MPAAFGDDGPTWTRGDQVVLRYRRLGPVSFAVPSTVVSDTPGLTRLYLRPGTPLKRRLMPDGTPIPRAMPYGQRARLPVVIGDGTWATHHTLILIRPGDAFDIRLFWHEDGWVFRGWYVNLQAPVTRFRGGFDTADHILDLRVAPDRTWSWKDEDELEAAVRIGRFSVDAATGIRETAERLIPHIEAGRWPFDDSLLDWRPDPAWPIPALPATWSAA